ncbi:MAG: FHA domain-containing protein [Chloroflexota bacterium]
MKLKLDEIEGRIRELIEVRMMSILPGSKVEAAVIQKLVAAMQDNLIEAEGNKIAPSLYTLVTGPGQGELWQDSRVVDALDEILHTAGREAGLHFTAPPKLSFSTDPRLATGEVNVVASHPAEGLGKTQGMETGKAEAEAESEGEGIPENAFLIIDGVKIFPLTEMVVNIGRRMENQLVIDDPRISRNHAQLRAIKGRFVIFDLNSTGGMFVNGQRTNQSVLYPGDVISLAGVSLVFGQDNPPPRPDLKNTGPFFSPTSERPTAVLKERSTITKKKK